MDRQKHGDVHSDWDWIDVVRITDLFISDSVLFVFLIWDNAI